MDIDWEFTPFNQLPRDYQRLINSVSVNRYRGRPVIRFDKQKQSSINYNYGWSEEILIFIQEYFDDNGYPPTQREIAENLNFALGTVTKYLAILESEKRIKRLWRNKRYGARAITVLP